MDKKSSNTSAIFIVGNSRTGTSMVSKILGKNERVFTFNELHFFEQLWYPEEETKEIGKDEAIALFSELISIQRDGYLSQKSPEKYYPEAVSFFGSFPQERITPPVVFMEFLKYESRIHHKSIPCEQTPRNLFFIEEITRLYPDAKIVCMMRDPRDVLLSQKYKWKRRYLGHNSVPVKEVVRAWFNYHPITISKLWSASAKKIIQSLDKENVHLVKFEDLVEDPERVIGELCSFLNIDFSPSMLLIPINGSSIVTDQQGKSGIDKTRAGNFMKGLSMTEIYFCQKFTAEQRKRFGYAEVPVKKEPINLYSSYVSFPVKLFFAILLNLQRSKNFISSIRRRFI